MLYQYREFFKSSLAPYRFMVQYYEDFEQSEYNFLRGTSLNSVFNASFEMLERITREYPKLGYNIKTCEIDGKKINIIQQTMISKPFCHLIHFKKAQKISQPKLLIISPMSGHHSTLLRHTIQEALPFFDVYITDWIDARYVPLEQGSFDLDDYIDYCVEFSDLLSPKLNILAVCQSAVPALAAISLCYSEKGHEIPDSLTIMGGPIDTRKNPTEVDKFALQRNMDWFEDHVITKVPAGYPGHGRLVYPGFLQLAGFIMMNPQRHIESHVKLFNSIVNNETDKVALQRNFYDEYFSVMDMSAEFYMQTIKSIFKNHDLALGKMKSRGRKIDPSLITKTAMFGIEGEKDDITGIGQTKAGLALCSGLKDDKKQYHLQNGVGHYGIFSGRRYKEEILPLIVKFVKKHSAD
jgi:poly(3-hydroxybutyrate) depolymerase